MNTQEMPTQGCCAGGKKKKIVIGVALTLLAIAIVLVGIAGLLREVGARGAAGQRAGGYAQQGRGLSVNNITYAVPTPVADENQFVAPGDAAETGQLAVTVDSIDSAKKAVSDIANNNSGNVYSTFIAYSSNSIKNGSMTVQVPIENFDSAFAALRNVGKSVVQESTQQIEKRDNVVYPMMQGVAANVSSTDGVVAPQASDAVATVNPAVKKTSSSKVSAVSGEAVATPTIAIAPYPYPGQVQDKGYIKIVFADYGAAQNVGQNAAAATGAQFSTQGMQKIELIGFVVKLLLLIVLLGLLIFIFKKIVRNLRLNKPSGRKIYTRPAEKKTVAHVVRQAPRSRIIDTKKK